jgi:hypothetical protein
MNKKQKILTIVALVVFGVIIVFHYRSISFGDAADRTIEHMTAD